MKLTPAQTHALIQSVAWLERVPANDKLTADLLSLTRALLTAIARGDDDQQIWTLVEEIEEVKIKNGAVAN